MSERARHSEARPGSEAPTEIDFFTQFAISLAEARTDWEPKTVADVTAYLSEQSRILNCFTGPRADIVELNGQLERLAEEYPDAPEKADSLRQCATVQFYRERYQDA